MKYKLDHSRLIIGEVSYDNVNIANQVLDIFVTNEFLSDTHIRLSSISLSNITIIAYQFRTNDTLIEYDKIDNRYILRVYGTDLLDKTTAMFQLI
jgi:hypothetical protein